MCISMIVSNEDFLRHIHYLPASEQELVRRALAAAIRFHEGQMRDSGLPYVTHPIAVADYLTNLEADAESLVVALLHDVVEDERSTFQELERDFGPKVATLVDGVTKLSKFEYQGRRGERQAASLRKMLLVASEDIRVLLIKLADRWHNIETISGLRPDKRVRVADETLDIYVPFARLVGLYDLKHRFEEVCFPIALPEESVLWHEAIGKVRAGLLDERNSFIGRIDAETSKDVSPRMTPMSDYEIFTRLQGNLKRLEDTRNVDSVVLVVDRESPKSCYEVLGEVHLRYPIRAFSFKDFISAPQPNGYRALHTAIFLSHNHQLLLRIQTKEMLDFTTKRKMSSWMENGDRGFTSVLASLSKMPFEHKQFLSDLKSNVLEGRINVFTTSGEVINLPKDGTGIDFAFALNPDHIAYLAGIRINGDTKEATAVLREGDTVELVLLDAANPSVRSHWVEKARSIEAREAVRENLIQHPRERQEAEGKAFLVLECRKRALPSWWLFHLHSIQKQLAVALDQASFTELLVGIGTGQILIGKVMDAYKEILVLSPTFLQKFLKFFHLLPRTRFLNADHKIITLEIYALDRKGLIYDITKCISERDINIANFGVYAVPPSDALYKITLEVEKFEEFSDLFDSLLQIPNVKTILRKT